MKRLLKIDKYQTELSIRLDPGAYCFTPFSGTGKTYLCSKLREYERFGEKVLAYSYDDYRRGIDLPHLLETGEYALALLDKYDAYYGYGSESIEKFGESGIILIDSKRAIDFCKFRFCNVFFAPGKIDVEI